MARVIAVSENLFFTTKNINQDEFRDPDAGTEVLRVGVKVPPFWLEEPTLWFAQVESQFTLSRITTDETKFCYLVAQLDHQYTAEVKDVITNPPVADKYLKLKTELIKRLSASKEKRVKQLLMHEELGDRKPSQKTLEGPAGPSVSKDFLATLWSSRLPQTIQTVIASQINLPLEKLAELADKVHEIAPSTPQVASASSNASSSAYDDLAKQVCELTKQVAQLTARLEHNSRSRSNTRGYNRSRSRSGPKQPPTNHPHCFYHFTYGTNARKCKKPCSFS